jgi:hypothetical protein
MTLGLFRPLVVLPPDVVAWKGSHRRATLLHEVAHVAGADVAFAFLARVVCGLFWFHPAAWWIARRLRDECETACDDRVLAAGVRPSDYVELLMNAADRARLAGAGRPLALALLHGSGLRHRLAAITGRPHDRRRVPLVPLTSARVWAVLLTIATAAPLSTVRLSPSRDVLTTLLLDARWDTRAFAVIGLAQRPDSIEVARAAAERDPSPRVRAWARFAVDRALVRDPVAPLLAAPASSDPH